MLLFHHLWPEMVIAILTILNLDRSNTLYLGDSIIDAKTAEEGKVCFSAVLHGTTKKEEFKNYDVNKFYYSIDDLVNDIL